MPCRPVLRDVWYERPRYLHREIWEVLKTELLKGYAQSGRG
jgi:hypothetical protein